jgi:hypothetical protein
MKIYLLKNLRNIVIGPLRINGKTFRLEPYGTIESDNYEDFKGFKGNPYYRLESIDIEDEAPTISNELVKESVGQLDFTKTPIEESISQEFLTIDEKVLEVPSVFDMKPASDPIYDVYLGDMKVNEEPITLLKGVAEFLKTCGLDAKFDSIYANLSKKFSKLKGERCDAKYMDYNIVKYYP